MSPRTYYQVLQVDSQASQAIIDAVYRKLAKRYHPDVNREPNALAKMQEINEAYAVIGDPLRRRQYNHKLRTDGTDYTKATRSEGSTTHRPNEYNHKNRTRQSHNSNRPNFPVACQKCGKSDSSLRIAAFPFVISLVLVTFRRGWGGVYCDQCRRQEMNRAKIRTFLFGWWGIPFGIFYTLGVLAKPSEGEVPKDTNAAYLRALGAYFLQMEKANEAKKAWSESLNCQYDRATDQAYHEVFGGTYESRQNQASSAQTSRTRSSTSGRTGQSKQTSNFGKFAWAGGIIIIVLFFAFIGLSIFDPTQTTSIAVAPSIPHTPTAPIPTPTPPVSPTKVAVDFQKQTTNSDQSPAEWHNYVNTKIGFNADIPLNFTAEVYPPSDDNPTRAVTFAADAHKMGPDATVISVVALPLPALKHYQQIDTGELAELTEEWLIEDGVEIVSSPKPTSISGHTAVELVHETHLEDDIFFVRANAAMIATPGWLYYIEVAGLAQYEDISRMYYETFIESFQIEIK